MRKPLSFLSLRFRPWTLAALVFAAAAVPALAGCLPAGGGAKIKMAVLQAPPPACCPTALCQTSCRTSATPMIAPALARVTLPHGPGAHPSAAPVAEVLRWHLAPATGFARNRVPAAAAPPPYLATSRLRI